MPYTVVFINSILIPIEHFQENNDKKIVNIQNRKLENDTFQGND